MEVIEGLDGEQWSQPDARHKRALALVKELEGHLSDAMNFTMEQQGSIVMLEAENKRLTELLAPPPRLVTVDGEVLSATGGVIEFWMNGEPAYLVEA